MIIIYTPENGEPEELDARRLRASEVQIIERTADMKWADVRQGLRAGDVTSVRTVAWALKKRAEPTLRLADFDPYDDEVRVRLDAREVEDIAAQLFARLKDDPESLAEAWEELRDAAHDREACELAIKEAAAPKDLALAPEPETTADGSPTAA
ncbi:hypothetical protein ACOKM5_23430 [Streptomyces sp. BH097]|uniref:hypothetical protein n=1 Tax=unclassified Streptomyces TaxID=2593676 RepID=UPI003BB69A09